MWVHLFPSRTQKLSTHTPTIVAGRLAVKIGNANIKKASHESERLLIYTDMKMGPPVSVCGARQKRRLTKQACFLPTAAHTYAPLHLPPAARGNAAIPNTEVKLMYADNSSKRKIQCCIFRLRKILPVSWLFLSPQRPFAFVGSHSELGDCLGR